MKSSTSFAGRIVVTDGLPFEKVGDEGKPVCYDDLLANDVELFTGYRREQMKHGIFELPLNLKRSHFSYAHSDDDVDRLLEANEKSVELVLAGRS